MHRSSESVAALATALAKAQGELVNPEKSLTATVQVDRQGNSHRTFRYAPLSSGLDIVRKTLGRHEIATVQTTAIDPATATVTLTTIFAHGSGEWISSEWPVCPVSDTATPRRMGAALTYARRYALFTLVGIAGEDDVDAPDLNDAPATRQDARAALVEPKSISPRPNQDLGRRPQNAAASRQVLQPEQSSKLAGELLTQLAGLTNTEDATAWAHSTLKSKNSLTQEDATRLEDAFSAKLAELSENGQLDGAEMKAPPVSPAKPSPVGRSRNGSIDKSKLKFGEPRRYRNKAHLQFVASQPCMICGRKPTDAHHLKFAQPRGLGLKVSDEFTVPLCRTHHRELHRSSNEPAWWATCNIEPLKLARKLWSETRLPAVR